MLQMDTNSKLFKIVYGVALPIAVVLVLLVIASFNRRPQLLGSVAPDLFVRFILCLWFCGLYIRLSRFSSFSFYPNKKWTKSDIGGLEKYFYIGISILFSVGCGIITYWVIRWFFPTFSNFAFIVASVNGLFIFLPMLTHYWVIKL